MLATCNNCRRNRKLRVLQSADTGSGFWAWLNVEAKVQSTTRKPCSLLRYINLASSIRSSYKTVYLYISKRIQGDWQGRDI